MTELRFDALLPGEMARRAEFIGVTKAEMPAMRMLVLSILAGAFIGLGAMFATTVGTNAAELLPYGLARMVFGLVFCLGLILVVVGGAELFTGNNLIVMAWACRKVTTFQVLRNWVIVFIGNFIGSVGTALLVFLSKQYVFSSGAIGNYALAIANNKASLEFFQALVLGILCNQLVCLAVWMSFSARSVTDKIVAIIFPITAFVAAGFEHSIANMYFVPIGLFIKMFDPVFAASSGLDLTNLTWGNFLFNNLLPVTIGNIIGGTVFVAAIYWFIFLQED